MCRSIFGDDIRGGCAGEHDEHRHTAGIHHRGVVCHDAQVD